GHAARLRSAVRRDGRGGRGEEPLLERAAVIDATRRIAWLAIATAGAAVLVLARMLEPDARGHGTHEQLGLPPCGFLELTGVPCPGCGLTTAFAHLARADLVPALEANAGALPLFLLTALAVPAGALGAIAGARFEPIVASRHTARASL